MDYSSDWSKAVLYRFGEYALDTQSYTLQRAGVVVPLEPQVFSVLLYLMKNRDRVVSRDDLVEAVWDGRVVSDAAISSRISSVRQAVGDNGKDQTVIKTIPRRGFRFVLPVDAPQAQPKIDLPVKSPQTVSYCATPDGLSLAYSVSGGGPVLLKTANWINHLEHDWGSPMWAPLFHELASYRKLLRYDSRGVGLSDWNAKEITFERLVTDLEAVIAASGVSEFALLGISQGAAVAIDYAVRNPDRVTHLILWGGFSRGRCKRGNPEDVAESEAFTTLIRQGWGKENSPFRQMFAALYLPEANDEQIRWWTDMQRVATSPDNAARLREEIDNLDVSDQLSKIQTPTLILHSEREAVAPISEARFMAARIPDARFVSLDSANHLVLHQEPAWQHAVSEIRTFLGES